MNIIKRSALLATAATLPLTLASAAYAERPAGSATEANSDQDTPLDVDLDLNLDDTDDLRVGARAISVNSDDGREETEGAQESGADSGSPDFNRIGTRAEIGLSNLDEVDTDARLVQEDENDGFSLRGILNLDDPDDIDTDVDATFLDDNENSDGSPSAGAAGPDDVMGSEDSDENGEQTFADDSEYVFGE